MPAHLDHTVIPAHDKEASANFLAHILGLEVGIDPFGYFAPVELGNGVFLEFADSDDFQSQHYAFWVGEDDFDAALARIIEAGLVYHTGPSGTTNEIYFRDGGRGVYFEDPNGHHMELVTVPSSTLSDQSEIRTGPYQSNRGDESPNRRTSA